MARLTPNEILKLSEPVEQVYSNIVDALLINMGKHFNSGHSIKRALRLSLPLPGKIKN